MKRVSTPYEIIISGDVENFRSIEGVVLVDTPEDAERVNAILEKKKES